LRRFHLFFPLQDGPQDLPAKILLGDGGKRSGISHFHALSISFVDNKCKLFYAPINKFIFQPLPSYNLLKKNCQESKNRDTPNLQRLSPKKPTNPSIVSK
jgi:hypothetical protein